MAGHLYVGTSGFAYPDWAPCFYPAGLRDDELLAAYSRQLPACELNNTYYRNPSPERVAAWSTAVPAAFRFTVKAQRGTAGRALRLDPAGAVARLVAPLAGFGTQLGSVLLRVPAQIARADERDDERLAAVLAAWPREIPLTLDLQDPSWHVDEVFALARGSGAAICVTETDDSAEPPIVRLTGSHLYLRLRRTTYSEVELAAWVARARPFLDAGHDVYAFLRHDETGVSGLRALELRRMEEGGR